MGGLNEQSNKGKRKGKPAGCRHKTAIVFVGFSLWCSRMTASEGYLRKSIKVNVKLGTSEVNVSIYLDCDTYIPFFSPFLSFLGANFGFYEWLRE